MVPILMLNEKRPTTQNPQGTHLMHAKYVIDQSVHILRDLAVLCSGIPITTHSLCMIQPATTYYSHIPLSAYKICALHTILFLCAASLSVFEILKSPL